MKGNSGKLSSGSNRCEVGCIGCKMCVKAGSGEAVTYGGSVVKFDYKVCIEYGPSCETACITKCPRDIFRLYAGPQAIARSGADGLRMAG